MFNGITSNAQKVFIFKKKKKKTPLVFFSESYISQSRMYKKIKRPSFRTLKSWKTRPTKVSNSLSS